MTPRSVISKHLAELSFGSFVACVPIALLTVFAFLPVTEAVPPLTASALNCASQSSGLAGVVAFQHMLDFRNHSFDSHLLAGKEILQETMDLLCGVSAFINARTSEVRDGAIGSMFLPGFREDHAMVPGVPLFQIPPDLGPSGASEFERRLSGLALSRSDDVQP